MSIGKNNGVTQTASALLNNNKNTVHSINNSTMQTSSKNHSPALEQGKVIKGEITNIQNHEVTIKLETNETITAPLKDGGELSIGQIVSFEVVADSENGFALKPLLKDLPPALEHTLNKALEAAGLPKNIKNLEIVKQLLSNQMSIDKQSIQNILRQSLLHPKASIDTLVFMAKHQIPITEVNAAQLENCRNYEHRIACEVDSISNSLSDLFANAAQETDFIKLNTIHSDFITALLSDTPDLPMDSNFIVFTPEEKNDLLLLLKNYPVSDTIQKKLLNGNVKELMNFMENNLSSGMPEDKETLINQMKSPLISNIQEQFTHMLRDQGKIGGILTPEDREKILLTFKEFPLEQSILDNIKSGEMPTKELLDIIKSYLPLLDQTAAKEFFSGSIYKALVKEQLRSNWTLTPKELTTPNALVDLYERMDKQLAELIKLTSNINNSNPFMAAQNTASKSASDMNGLRQNIDFMKSLNELFTYVQLPIRFKEKTLHSDLYVYTNKKEMKKNKNNISVLLHLDMDYLGSLDIHVNLNNFQVNSKFYFDKEDSVGIVKSNIEQLETALNKKGYSFQFELLKREKQMDLIEEFAKKDTPDTSMKRYTFDLRA